MRALDFVRRFAFSSLALVAGCAAPSVNVPTKPHPYPQVGTSARAKSVTTTPPHALSSTTGHSPIQPAAAAEAVPVSPHAQVNLDGLLALARAHNPDLAAAAAKVEEARGRMIQAGLYPNPTAGYSGMQINDGPGTAGQQGGFISQEFVTGRKLRIAREAARFGVTAADWQATSKWFETAARVKAAYYEYATALAVQKETEQMQGLFTSALSRTEKLAAGGKVDSYDVSRIKVEVTQIRNRLGAACERVKAAERLLAIAIGIDRLPGDLSPGDLGETLPQPTFDEAAALVAQSSFVQAAEAEVDQARVEVRQAEVKPVPNVHAMTTVAHDYVTRAPMASIQVGLPLPVWDRNQGHIVAARARLQTVTAGVEQTRLRQIERLTNAYQKYENARRQLELYRTKVLPDAAAALEQIDKVYSAKGERFFDTLDARRVLSQARIDYAQALGDLWSSIAEIEAVIQPVCDSNHVHQPR